MMTSQYLLILFYDGCSMNSLFFLSPSWKGKPVFISGAAWLGGTEIVFHTPIALLIIISFYALASMDKLISVENRLTASLIHIKVV